MVVFESICYKQSVLYVYIIVLHAVERSSFILMQFPWGVDETNHKGGLVLCSHKNKDRQICIHSFQV